MGDKIVCRCCLAKKPPAPNQWKLLSEAQKYLDLINECFNINLITSLKSGICDGCAEDVVACTRFRQKVINAEAVFINTCLAGECEENTPIKEELDSDGGADAEDSDDNFLADTVKTQVQIKTEEELKGLKRKREKKTNMKTLKILAQDRKGDKVIFRIGQCTVLKKEKKNIPTTPRWKLLNEKQKHVQNIETILECSNVTVFKKTTLHDFQCGICDLPFRDPNELRTHAEKNHKKDKLNRKWYDILDHSIKVDITDLKCNLCDDEFANLQLLKLHLSNTHDKLIHVDIKDHIIQFKLKLGEEYNCVLCSSTYETFKMLNQHMHTHYSNYKCDKCDASFATKRSLSSHKKTHVEGVYKCNLCENVYSNKVKMQYHVRKNHLGLRYISSCVHCDMQFTSYYQRNQHMIQVHKANSQYKCKICDRDFFLKSLLMTHIKKNHLMERNSQCNECGYKFFSSKGLKAHMVKHTGEKKHQCPVCKKAFGRKYTLNEHMRIHNNDRRFKCQVCELSFVQKCSLKSHLLSNHGISLPACEISVS